MRPPGHRLDDARRIALDEDLEGLIGYDMAETNLLRGEALPLPDPSRHDENADIEEPIYLMLRTGNFLHQRVACPKA